MGARSRSVRGFSAAASANPVIVERAVDELLGEDRVWFTRAGQLEFVICDVATYESDPAEALRVATRALDKRADSAV